MDFLYLTADKIGAPTGGGQVTGNEWEALKSLGAAEAWSFHDAERPWGSDALARDRLNCDPNIRPRLAHIYAGCFTETVRILQERGCKVVYTVAAHDRHVSRQEHEDLARMFGRDPATAFPFPHLTDDEQFARYSGGYRNADIVVAPGEAPRRVLIADGVPLDRIRVIPHGHNPPDLVKPLPAGFHVGYLGSAGADKGLRYLIEAWASLDYPDAVLHIAGPGTEHLWPLVRRFGRGNFNLRGYVKSPSDLYNTVNLYVQPSATEGFGIEVVEAMAHGRMAICSDGAGAAQRANRTVPARDASALASAIEEFRAWHLGLLPTDEDVTYLPSTWTGTVENASTWWRVRGWYVDLWREVLNG